MSLSLKVFIQVSFCCLGNHSQLQMYSWHYQLSTLYKSWQHIRFLHFYLPNTLLSVCLKAVSKCLFKVWISMTFSSKFVFVCAVLSQFWVSLLSSKFSSHTDHLLYHVVTAQAPWAPTLTSDSQGSPLCPKLTQIIQSSQSIPLPALKKYFLQVYLFPIWDFMQMFIFSLYSF